MTSTRITYRDSYSVLSGPMNGRYKRLEKHHDFSVGVAFDRRVQVLVAITSM